MMFKAAGVLLHRVCLTAAWASLALLSDTGALAQVVAPTAPVTDFFAPFDVTRTLYVFPQVLKTGPQVQGEEVRGTVNLSIAVREHYGGTRPFDALSLIYTLDGTPISPRLGPPYIFAWNTAAIPDGTHALGVVLVDGPADMQAFRVIPTSIVIDNIPGPVAGPQRVPSLGMYAYINTRLMSPEPDWVTVPSSTNRVHATPRPYPYKFSPPAHALIDPSVALDSTKWFLESLTQPNSRLYQGVPSLFRTKTGHLTIQSFYYGGDTSETSTALPFQRRRSNHDGPRNDNSVSPYSTYVPDPLGPGWVGVDIAGRIFRVSPTGEVVTIAGEVMDSEAIPFDRRDDSIPITHFDSLRRTVGVFVDGARFKGSTDLAFDPRNSSILYIADYLNHRIAKVDLSAAPPRITTYAGRPGVAGYQDGAAATALFDEPSSIAIAADGTLYVADEHNKAVRRISPDGQTVSTLAVHSVNAPLAPFALRLNSEGHLVVMEKATGYLKRVLTTSGAHSIIAQIPACAAPWSWLDVDRRGNVGPKDDALLACNSGGVQHVYRVSKDGLRKQMWPSGGANMEQGRLNVTLEPAGHYAWVVAIDDEESRIIFQGHGNLGLRSIRLAQADDPAYANYLNQKFPLTVLGKAIFERGTIPNFPFGIRPSFTALRGVNGHTQLGVVPTFDDMASMSDAELGAYIQAGMGGSVPRPEITGRHLDALIYYIRMNSLRGAIVEPAVPAPRPDIAIPVISDVRVARINADTLEVSWYTNEPTMGFVAFGTSAEYHRWSDLETGYATFHRVTLENVPAAKEIHYAIRSKDTTGNQAMTADFIFLDGPPARPDIALRVTPTTLQSGGSVSIRWASTGSRTCTASGGWLGTLAPQGFQSRGPLTANTAYTLTCSGPGGTSTKSVPVQVTPPPKPPALTITATPTVVSPGGSSTLNWSATNVTNCIAYNSWTGTKPVSGTYATGPLQGNRLYSITCSGPNGSITRHASVTVSTARAALQ